MTRTELVRNAGGFRDGLHGTEDWDLWIRISKLTEIFKLDTELACYRVNPSGISQSALEHFRELKKVYENHAFQPDVPQRILRGAKVVLQLRQAKHFLKTNLFLKGLSIFLLGIFYWIQASLSSGKD